ncbi:hypothetical protein L3X38_028017 [Prunus dulcis]|uniref:Uncharacterized protein n=1 Tax=Prunus dulcis TaxID=3755 RepID=A0AAD4VNV9_PRUDU|nr:hypothetical protein L3X38_028017 [Prunus dulcis]
MKSIFKSHGLWELVEKGIECSYSKGAGEYDAKKKEKEESSGAGKMTLTELLMKNAKALGLIKEQCLMRSSLESLIKKLLRELGIS